MSAPMKPWESATLENKGHIVRHSQLPAGGGTLRAAPPPTLPPRPQGMSANAAYGSYNSAYSPYSSYGNSYNYGSMGWPGRSPYGGGYGGYGSYGSYGNSYGMYGNGYMNMNGMGTMGIRDDAESRFIQFAEDSSRNTFANVEAIVRAFNGIAMMLDNTFFAMTSSFRAVLGVAENFGRLRSMFGHIWQAVNIFRLFTWLHRKLMGALGVKIAPSSNNLAWNEAVSGIASEAAGSTGSSWPTLAFFGVLFSAPYFISKLLPKYEDKCDPSKWKANGVPAKAVFDFAATAPNELTLHVNDEILLAPKAVQEEMRLSNSGWAYATCNGHTGVVPLNYIVIVKKVQKRVSFGETRIFNPPPIETPQPQVDNTLPSTSRTSSKSSINNEPLIPPPIPIVSSSSSTDVSESISIDSSAPESKPTPNSILVNHQHQSNDDGESTKPPTDSISESTSESV